MVVLTGFLLFPRDCDDGNYYYICKGTLEKYEIVNALCYCVYFYE